MSTANDYPRVVFPDGFSDHDEWEMTSKGFVYATIELSIVDRYELFFIDPVRLKQDVEDTLRLGDGCYVESALVVVPEVTVAAITKAIPQLIKEGFFDRLRPAEKKQITKR